MVCRLSKSCSIWSSLLTWKDIRICGVVIEASTVDGSALSIERVTFPEFTRTRERPNADSKTPQDQVRVASSEEGQVAETAE